MSLSDWRYVWPEITNPSAKNPCLTTRQRAEKVVEEACEAFDEAKRAGTSAFDREAYLMELLDTAHAVETALKRDFTEEEVAEGARRVYRKNAARGYYGEAGHAQG